MDELEVSHLIHLIGTCETNEIQLYIVNSPRYNIVEEAMAYTKSICSGRNVTFLDYSDLLLEKPEMFRDAGHLLDEGAKVFTRELAKGINETTN